MLCAILTSSLSFHNFNIVKFELSKSKAILGTMATTAHVNSDPSGQEDEDIFIPSAAAIPITDDCVNDSALSHKKMSSSDASYASARVLPLDASPSAVLDTSYATDTAVTAIALDPWNKEPTAASTMANSVDPLTEEQQQALSVVVTVPPDSNDPAHEPIYIKKLRRRRRRRGRMIIAGATGFIVGAMVLGPIGAYAGAVGGAAIAHGASKAGERRKDRRVAKRRQQQLQQNQQGAQLIRTARASR